MDHSTKMAEFTDTDNHKIQPLPLGLLAQIYNTCFQVNFILRLSVSTFGRKITNRWQNAANTKKKKAC